MAQKKYVGNRGDYILVGSVRKLDYEVMVRGLTPEERAKTVGKPMAVRADTGRVVVMPPKGERTLGVASKKR